MDSHIYHVYWVSWMNAYRLYDTSHPEQTVAYVDSLSEIDERGIKYVLEAGV